MYILKGTKQCFQSIRIVFKILFLKNTHNSRFFTGLFTKYQNLQSTQITSFLIKVVLKTNLFQTPFTVSRYLCAKTPLLHMSSSSKVLRTQLFSPKSSFKHYYIPKTYTFKKVSGYFQNFYFSATTPATHFFVPQSIQSILFFTKLWNIFQNCIFR